MATKQKTFKEGDKLKTTRRNGETVTARLVAVRSTLKGEWYDVVPVLDKKGTEGKQFSIRPSMAR
jgi:hypothetical protein